MLIAAVLRDHLIDHKLMAGGSCGLVFGDGEEPFGFSAIFGARPSCLQTIIHRFESGRRLSAPQAGSRIITGISPRFVKGLCSCETICRASRRQEGEPRVVVRRQPRLCESSFSRVAGAAHRGRRILQRR